MLITPYWQNQQVQLHLDDPGYGGSGHKISGLVEYLAGTIDARSALDYGCGKATLSQACPGLTWCNYDPAISEYRNPQECDFVVCSDVMEHVEEQCVPAVIANIFGYARRRCALFVISLAPGTRMMPDGSLAHCTVKSRDWWLDRLTYYGMPLELPPTGPKRDELVVWIR